MIPSSQPGEPTERLQEIQQRLDKATRGPWRYCGCGKCGLVWQPIADFIVAHAEAADDHEPGPSLTVRAHNAELIGHAPGDLSYLLGEVASLRQQNAELKERLRGADQRIQKMLAKKAHIERLNEDDSPGGLDEIVAFGYIHVERMDDDHVWASLGGHSFDFTSQHGQVVWSAQDPEALRASLVPGEKEVPR